MVSAIRLSAWLCLGATALGVTASAQTPANTSDELTLDAIYGPGARVDFSGSPTTNLRWIGRVELPADRDGALGVSSG